MNISGKVVALVPPFDADDLFDFEDEVERREVERIFVERTYRFDEMVFEQGFAAADVWRLVSGMAVLSQYDASHEPSFVRMVRPGEILGLTETLAGLPYSATLRAVSSCVFNCMKQSDLVWLLHRRPRLRQRIVRVLAANYGNVLASAAEAVRKHM